ncbi:signal peptidase I [Candidatus Woesearchaeota archaeon]|nr:signal peptidase I [Candidatus Woesearchaeota archaeon]
MNKEEFKKVCQRTWHFLWEEDSFASWLVNILVAFVLIKFIVYPGLGLALGTSFPVVAVISGSMEHDGNFDEWWQEQALLYKSYEITETDFKEYPFRNGFNKGDIMVLHGVREGSAHQGDVLVFQTSFRKEPIIHRIVNITAREGEYHYQTKGDHNPGSWDFEKDVPDSAVLGKAVFRIPLLGYVKIIFVELLKLLHLA